MDDNIITARDSEEQAIWRVNAALEARHDDWARELSIGYERELAQTAHCTGRRRTD